MGVKHLWSFISPIKKHVTVESLNGQIIAVDLSIWIMEAQNQVPKHISKPHLRHLFFRVSHLLQLGIFPLIVIEGVPPEIKQGTMRNRLGNVTGGKVRRSRFNALHRECCEMLEYLGLPYVQAAGEAEAMCAYMNAEGLVNGCITNDGDAFLYGARIVYRNFSINQKVPFVEAYDAYDIERELKMTKETMIGLAVLCGCDYLPKGVEGCGKETIRKLLENLNGESLLERFKVWSRLDQSSLDPKSLRTVGFDDIELTVCKKAVAHPDFPFKKVITEFSVNRNKIPNIRREWSRPNLIRLVRFSFEKMEWPEEYTASKVVPLMTLFDMRQIAGGVRLSQDCMKPKMIVKKRMRQGEPCYEVQWEKLDSDIYTTEEFYVTFEEQSIFKSAHPSLVEQFELGKDQKKKASKKPTKTQNNKIDAPRNLFRLNEVTEKMDIYEVKEKQTSTRHPPIINKFFKNDNHHKCLPEPVTPPGNRSRDDDDDDDEPLYIPLMERLKLQKAKVHQDENNILTNIVTTPKSLPRFDTTMDISPCQDDLFSNDLIHPMNISMEEIYGNFDVESSLLDFSMCPTPAPIKRHETILTPHHKIELMTPVRTNKTPRHHVSIENLEDSQVRLPLLERLKRKMGKQLAF